MKKRYLALLLAACMAFSLFAACSKDEQPPAKQPEGEPGQTQQPVEQKPSTSGEEKVLVVRASGDPQTFHPDLTGDDNAYPIVQNIFNRLVKLDSSKQVIPDLAETWEVSEDGMKITFHLREGLKWHDGQPLTAEDCAYTFETIKANETCFFNANMQTVASVEAPDDLTVVFNMNEPNVALVGYLAWYGTFIMPKHIYDNGQSWDENPANMKPIGSGPFKFEDYKPGVSTTLVKNAEYWETEPKMDKVIYQIIPDITTAVQALVNGEIDILESIPDAEYENLSANPDVRLEPNVYPSPVYIAFNFNEPLVQDQAVRTALAMCIDRESIAQKVYGGIRHPEDHMYPSVVEWASNGQDVAPGFDVEGAIKVLEDAGYTKDSDGYYVRGLIMDCFESGGSPDVAKLIQADAKNAGLEIILNVQEYNAWNQKVYIDRNFIVEMQGGFQGPDPAALASRVGTGGSMNQSSYSNAEVDALFAEAAKTGDQDKRAELYKQAQAILAKELPIIPIVDYTSFDACGSNVINAPIDGVGKWGWQEFTFTDFK